MRTSDEVSVTLKNLHSKVWSTRNKVKAQWPTPDTLSSALYAFTEIGEAVDAVLRDMRPDDARNRNKESGVEQELAQCLMMVLTAMGEEGERWLEYDEDDIFWFENIVEDMDWAWRSSNIYLHLIVVCNEIAGLLSPMIYRLAKDEVENEGKTVAMWLALLCDKSGINISHHLSKELSRIEEKYS